MNRKQMKPVVNKEYIKGKKEERRNGEIYM
jgi:hypothetical protein